MMNFVLEYAPLVMLVAGVVGMLVLGGQVDVGALGL